MSPEPRDGFDPNELAPLAPYDREPIESDEDVARVDFVPASSIRMEQTRWAWKDRIPLGGVTLLAGQEGSGKTTLLADVLARATRGQLEGDLQGEPVGCVFATAEDSWARTLAPRFAAAGADLDLIYFVQVDGLNGGLSIPSDLAPLAERMRATGSRILVLDPLGAHLGASLDTHRDAAVRQALAPLASWMDSLCAACVGIVHWSKAPTTVALDRVNGSRAFTAAARAMLAVGDDPNDESCRVLILAKSNLGRLDVPALKYRIEGRTVAAHDDTEIATSGVAWIGEAPGIGVHDIFGTLESAEDRSARDDLVAVIEDALADGPQEMQAIKVAVRNAGMDASAKSIQRACARAEIVRKPAGFGGKWLFSLPQSGQIIPMSRETVHSVHTGGEQDIPESLFVQSAQSGQSGHSGRDVRNVSTSNAPPPEDSLFENGDDE